MILWLITPWKINLVTDPTCLKNQYGSLIDLGLVSNPVCLTHWGRTTHICVSKLTIIVSDNGLSPGRRQVIIWNNVGILSIGLLGTNFSEFLIEILTFSFKKMRLKVSSGKWRPFCLGLNELKKALNFDRWLSDWHNFICITTKLFAPHQNRMWLCTVLSKNCWRLLHTWLVSSARIAQLW